MEKLNAMMKLNALKNALELCGVETEIEEREDMIILSGELWNCIDGSTIALEVGALEDDDWDIEVISYPCEKTQNILEFFV